MVAVEGHAFIVPQHKSYGRIKKGIQSKKHSDEHNKNIALSCKPIIPEAIYSIKKKFCCSVGNSGDNEQQAAFPNALSKINLPKFESVQADTSSSS